MHLSGQEDLRFEPIYNRFAYHKIAQNLNNGGNLAKIKWADVIGFVVGAVVGGAAGGTVTGVTTGIALGGFASKAFGEDK